jgi:hypothetical protein
MSSHNRFPKEEKKTKEKKTKKKKKNNGKRKCSESQTDEKTPHDSQASVMIKPTRKQKTITEIEEVVKRTQQATTYFLESHSYKKLKKNSSVESKRLNTNMSELCEYINEYVTKEITDARKYIEKVKKGKNNEGENISGKLRSYYGGKFLKIFIDYFDTKYGDTFTPPLPTAGDQMKPFKAQAEHWVKKIHVKLKERKLNVIGHYKSIIAIFCYSVFYNCFIPNEYSLWRKCRSASTSRRIYEIGPFFEDKVFMNIYHEYEIDGIKFMDEIDWMAPKTSEDKNTTPHKKALASDKDLTIDKIILMKWEQILYYSNQQAYFTKMLTEALKELSPELKNKILIKLQHANNDRRPNIEEPIEEEPINMDEARNKRYMDMQRRAKCNDPIVNSDEEGKDHQDQENKDAEEVDNEEQKENASDNNDEAPNEDKSPLPDHGNMFGDIRGIIPDGANDEATFGQQENESEDSESAKEDEKDIAANLGFGNAIAKADAEKDKITDEEQKDKSNEEEKKDVAVDEKSPDFARKENKETSSVFKRNLKTMEKECLFVKEFACNNFLVSSLSVDERKEIVGSLYNYFVPNDRSSPNEKLINIFIELVRTFSMGNKKQHHTILPFLDCTKELEDVKESVENFLLSQKRCYKSTYCFHSI